MENPNGATQDPELGGTTAAIPTPKVTSYAGAASPQPSSDGDCVTAAPHQTTTAAYSRHPLLEKAKGHVPRTVHKSSSKVWTYLRGPQPPSLWKISPFLPRLQQFPLRLVDRICPKQWQRILALFLFYVCWIATFAAVLHESSVTDDVNGYGQPLLLNCGGVFWYLPLQVWFWLSYTNT